MSKKTAIIIGGGPAGLTAALELLRKTDIQPVVIEMSDFWGGISRTESHNGNRIDIGGHRFFSKSDVVMNWWQEIMPVYTDDKSVEITYHNRKTSLEIQNSDTDLKEEQIMLVRKRKSRIYYKKQFFNYPISLSFNTISKLGYVNTCKIGFSYLKSVVFPIRNVENLEQFFINRFGKRLYATFFRDYTEKVWGVPCTEITAEWGAQRIKGLSVTKSLLNAFQKALGLKNKALSQKDTETSLIEYFLYPKYGPGQMWEIVADKIKAEGGILIKDTKAINFNFNHSQKITQVEIENLVTSEKEKISADFFISTMPVNELIKSFNTTVPKDVKVVSDGLTYRNFLSVGLLIDQLNHELEDTWIYIQENYVKVGRLQIFNNWSPYLVNDPSKTWVGLEYFCDEDDVWILSDKDLKLLAVNEMITLGFINSKENVLDSKVVRARKAYPGYFGTYDKFKTIRDFTDNINNLFLVGRNGMHKYNNQDHSMLTAMKAVELIGKNSNDKESIWDINTEEEFHEEK